MAGIKIDVHYKQPPHAIWHALTDPGLLARWLMPNNFRPEPGCEFEFRAKPVGGWDGIAHCKVLEIDAPNKLTYSWKSNKIETVVTFTLRPEDGGAWLRFSHTGFAGLGGFVAKMFMGPGWRKKLHKTLPEILAEN